MLTLILEYSGSRLPFFVTIVRDPDGLSSAGLSRLFPSRWIGLVRFDFDLFEDVTHIEQISNPYFGRLVCKHESVEKSESVPRVTKAVLIGARSEVMELKTCWE